MKKLLMVSNGGRYASRTIKATLGLLLAVALVGMFWVASVPSARAQNMSPSRMISAELPPGQTIENAGKADFLAAVCAAVQKHRAAAPQIVRFAVQSHPQWKKDILRTAFRCLGTDDCRLLGRVVRELAVGPDAAEIMALAVELAPNCAGSFVDSKDQSKEGGGRGTEGSEEEARGFGAPPANLNPPPGSIGGGGGQGNVIAVCFNGITQFFTPEGAAAFINSHPGATLGACVVTPATNR